VIEIGGKKLDAKVEKLGIERDGDGIIRSVVMTLLLDTAGREQVSNSFRDPMDPNWFHGDLPRWKAQLSWEHQNATREEMTAMVLMDEAPTTMYLRPIHLEVKSFSSPNSLAQHRATVELLVIEPEEK